MPAPPLPSDKPGDAMRRGAAAALERILRARHPGSSFEVFPDPESPEAKKALAEVKKGGPR